MKARHLRWLRLGAMAAAFLLAACALLSQAQAQAPAPAPAPAHAQPQQQKPNIIVIMGDDIGWFNVGAYNQGIMYSTTPNLDKLASEGMRFTDYYAEPSCTAGRANFITGELPIRTGLTTVGQAGATVGMPDEAPTIATALKAMGYDHGPVRQEPSGRPEPLSSDRARVRRVSSATSITSTRWRTRSGTPIRRR